MPSNPQVLTTRMKTLADIEKRMAELDALIRDAKGRVPAHSPKPGIMMELLDLEDEYESLMAELADLKKSGS